MKVLLWTILVLAVGVAPASASGPGVGGFPVASRPSSVSSQSDLDGAVSAFARAWLAEDLAAVASLMSREGIRLQVGGEDHPVLSARQARAALEELLGSRSTRGLDVSRLVDLGGDPPRGFAEMRWEAVVDRTSEALLHTVFVSFERDGTSWHITEIRVL